MKRTQLVSAIVPAFNEERTIRDVVRTLLTHPSIGEVIVVDDGSTDRTAEQVRGLPVTLIELRRNCGKSAAMTAGVAAAMYPYIFFCDADVIGLSQPCIDQLLGPVLSGARVMHVGVRERKIWRMNKLLRITPVLGGERVLTKELWYRVPAGYKKNFQIEIALNYFAKQMPGGMGFFLMKGVTQIIKEKKYGLLVGLFRRTLMMWDIFIVGVKIYGFESLKQIDVGWSFLKKQKILSKQRLP